MKTTARRHTQNALINLLAFPGLGSLRSGRWGAGLGQISLVLAGTILLLTWLFKELSLYYGLMFGDEKPQSVGWIGILGGVLFGLSWLWAGVTSVGLFREAAESEVTPPVLAPAKKGAPQVSWIRAELTSLPQWQCDGPLLSRTYSFADFSAAMKFVNAVAALAEQSQHHPDIDVRWNRVTLALTTHEAGGLTQKDFTLARVCDAVAERQTANS